MSTETTLISDRLSGHNPDISGLDYSARLNQTSSRDESSTYSPVCQETETLFSDYRTNPDIVRTYPDISTNGFGKDHSQWQICSVYPRSRIDIFGTPATHPPENQGTGKSAPETPLLHIPTLIFQNAPPLLHFSISGGNVDITGGTISSRSELQQVTSYAVRTAVLHIKSPTQHIGAPAFRVSDRSGTPQAGNPAEEYSGERDPRRIWPRGTPNKQQATVSPA